jgi:hypothetical protein
MTTLDSSLASATALLGSETLSSPETHHLIAVQLHVARRADELSRRWALRSSHADRRAWLRAELEVFERLERRGS